MEHLKEKIITGTLDFRFCQKCKNTINELYNTKLDFIKIKVVITHDSVIHLEIL